MRKGKKRGRRVERRGKKVERIERRKKRGRRVERRGRRVEGIAKKGTTAEKGKRVETVETTGTNSRDRDTPYESCLRGEEESNSSSDRSTRRYSPHPGC